MSKRWLAAVAALALAAAACGDDADGGEATTTTEEEETTTAEEETTTTETEGERDAGAFGCSDAIPDCDGTVTPAEDLTDGATVSIEASGFTPDLGLGVTQCADANDPDHGIDETGPGDCNLRGIGDTVADADGNVAVEFEVVAGQTMVDNTENGRTCDAEHDCVVSVGELAPGADVERITFTLKFE
jgi:hypothetical protein